MTFSPEQLNFFKLSTVVLDEFPVVLRQVFVFMWDNLVAGVPKWDDSMAVRNMFLTKEGGKTKYVPTNKPLKEWDCTALFEATIFAKTFAMPDGTGKRSTLKELYVKSLPSGTFHHSVISPTGNQAETYALALDQLRLLRNMLCHQISTRKIDKATFDGYVLLAKDAFTALGQNTTTIEEIGKLAEEDFPTARQRKLEDELKREKDAAIKFEQIEDHLKKIESQVGDVGSEVKDVKTEITDVQTQVEDVGSHVKDVKTQVADVGSDVKELKADVDQLKQAMQAESSKGPLAPDSCIPEEIPHFVGRQQQCAKIFLHLTRGSTRLVDIWGPPGFGKTSVAINVAHHLRAMEIPVYFISLRGMKRKDDLVSKLLSIFTVIEQRPLPQLSASDWLIQCLQQLQSHFVLILDNADDLLESGDAKLKDEVLRFVDEMVTRCNHIKLLLTTRDSLNYLSHKLPMYLERVGVLDEVASGRLVRFLLPDLSEDDCKSIVRECGQVPLAIRLMCSIMIEGNVSLNELLDEMKRAPLVEVLDNESFPDDVRLKSIINKSFQRLTADERDAFVSLAVFPGSFGLDEATAILDMKTAFRTKKMLQLLEQKSLMIRKDFVSVSYTIHSLLLSFIDEKRIEDEEIEVVFKVAEHRFYDYHISIFRVANEKFLTGHSYEALRALFERRERIILSLLNGTSAEELYPKVVEVLSKAELFLHLVLSDEESLFEKLYNTAMKEAKKRQNLLDERMLLAAKSFGHWAWFTTDRQTWEQPLQSAGCSNTSDFPAKMLCYHGIYQLLCGKVDEGLSSLRSSIDRLGSCCDEEVLRVLSYKVLADTYRNKEEHEVASHFQNLFNCEVKASSRFIQCQFSEDGLFSDDINDIMRRLNDDSSFFCLKTKLLWHFDRHPPFPDAYLNGVSKVTAIRAKLDSAGFLDLDGVRSFLKELNEIVRITSSVAEADSSVEPESLEVPKKLFYPLFEDIDQLLSLLSEDILGEVKSLKPLTHLIELLLFLTETEAQLHGPRWPTFIDTASLKFMIEGCRDHLESDRRKTMINDRFAAIQGEHHDRGPGMDFEDLARSHDKLGIIQHRIENYNGAIESHQLAIRVREETIGDHVDTVSSLTNIGCLYFKMNNEIEAAKSFQSALELRKKLGVYDHEDTANIYHTLGENYLTLGNYEKAMEAHLQALELRRKHLGEHPTTAESLNGLGVVYYKMGENQYARETFHNVVNVTRKMLGEHEQTANGCYNLALTYLAMGSYPEALEFCQQALSMRLELPGKPLDKVASFYTLGRISFKMGDKESAIEAFQKAAKIKTLPFGASEETARCYYWLGKAQYGLGDLNGAIESLQEATRLRKKILGDHPDTAKSQKLLNCVCEALSANELDCD